MKYAYLAVRESLLPKEASVLQLPEAVTKGGQTGVAAVIVRAHMWGHELVEQRKLPDGARGEADPKMGGLKVCLAQFERLYGTCRIPRAGCDEVVLARRGSRPTHIAVVHRGRWFTQQACSQNDNKQQLHHSCHLYA